MNKLFGLFFTVLSIAFLVGGGAVYGAGTATATPTPSPQGEGEMVIVEVDGSVKAQHETENLYVIGGDFSRVKIDGSSPISRNRVAIINKERRSLSSWNPVLDGDVTSITSSRSYLIVSGEFTTVNGEDIPYLALFNLDDLTLAETQYQVNGPVWDVEVYDGRTLFIGGEFTVLEGQSRPRLASVVLPEDRISSWNPAPNDNVYALHIDRDYLYVGGSFTEIAGEERRYVASFYLPSGTLSVWNPSADSPVYDLRIAGGSLLIQTQSEGSQTFIEDTLDIDTTTQADQETPIETVSVEEEATVAGLMIDTEELGFQIPTLADVLTFAIRVFFVIAGLAALFYLLLGAFGWVTSGGDKDSITAARDKIQAAIIGLIMMVVVLAIVWTLEQVIFRRRICLGLSCPLTLPSLIEPIEETSP